MLEPHQPSPQIPGAREEHGLLLVTSLVVSWIVSLLMQRQRELADNEHRLVLRSEQLRRLGDALREVDFSALAGEERNN